MLMPKNLETHRLGMDAVTPRTDLVETAEHFLLYMDLPGVPREQISVKMSDGMLTITGFPEQDETGGRRFLRSEVEHAAFHRHVRLSEDAVDINGISALLKNGVLSVTIPKRHRGRRRRIPVQRVQ
jgi:HSP20 family protein